MTTEVIETPASAPADPEPQETQTETPDEEPRVPDEGAAEEPEAAAVPQVEVVEEKPEYLTKAEWEKEKAEVAQRAAAEALENDRRRRQTENARKAQQEQREREDAAEAADVIRAALVSQGMDPAVATEESVLRTVNRLAGKKAERIASGQLDSVEQAWDYLTAPAYGKSVDLEPEFEEAARRLSPKLQHLVDQIRPAIEAEARKGYIAESDLPKRVDDEIARRNAKTRQGTSEIKRPEGSPSSTIDRSLEAVAQRIISNKADDEDHTLFRNRFKLGR